MQHYVFDIIKKKHDEVIVDENAGQNAQRDEIISQSFLQRKMVTMVN
jgi:hypothetical protein